MPVHSVFKVACQLGAVFMLVWLGLRLTVFDSPPYWFLLDAAIVIASLWVAAPYREDEDY